MPREAADFSLTASPGVPLPVAVRGSGARIWDSDGRSYIDACGGAMVMSLGHCHPRLAEVVKRQVDQLSFTYRFSFRNEPMLDLAGLLREVAPMEQAWCFFNSSGSESVESAIHLALLYWQLRGAAGKTDLISRIPSFHGSTLGALSLSGSRWRKAFEPVLAKHPCVPVANADIRSGRTPAQEAEWAAGAIEDAILQRGPEHVAAVVLETITGSSGAAVTPPDGYLRAVRAVCDRHDVLMVCDETITAFGRTGRWFACQHWDVVPDVVTYAKGVTSGIVPFSGMLVGSHIADAFEGSTSGFPWGHTFSGYPLGCAVAAETIRIIREEQLVDAARERGALLRERLEAVAASSGIVAQVRGRGLLQGMELVRDLETLEPLAGGSARVAEACRERGLMVYPCPTPMGRLTVEAIMLAPPLTTSVEEIDEIAAIVAEALAAVERAGV
jgi:adenosylmethionine-8-amino-7-oxononanoate aminotransferase